MSALYVKNLPAWERLLRVLMGLAIAGFAVYTLAGLARWLVAASALGIAVSGLVGFCPMCALVGRPLDKKA